MAHCTNSKNGCTSKAVADKLCIPSANSCALLGPEQKAGLYAGSKGGLRPGQPQTCATTTRMESAAETGISVLSTVSDFGNDYRMVERL